MSQSQFPRRVFVAGHQGMAGSAIVRRLHLNSDVETLVRSREELDLTDRAAVRHFFSESRPDTVILAAARVGGILANSRFPVEFMTENLMIAGHVIQAAYDTGTRRLIFLGSSCIYPREAPQPMREEALLTGPLEPTNEAYALAKICGLKLCQYFRQQYGVLFHSVMPTNLYGPGDNYHPEHSHVLPALLRRFHEAKVRGDSEVAVWGTGAPRREFLHVDDLASAVIHLLHEAAPPDWINVGTGEDLTVRELAACVADTVGYTGRITWDRTKPDGTPRKVLDVSRLFALGWRPTMAFATGLRETYRCFLEELESGSLRR